MEQEIKVEVPENMEIDLERSVFVFKPAFISLEEINEKMQRSTIDKILYYSLAELEQIKAIIVILNVAGYLNGGWKPDFRNKDEPKFYFALSDVGVVFIEQARSENTSFVYFKTKVLAKQAIDILGTTSIRAAFPAGLISNNQNQK